MTESERYVLAEVDRQPGTETIEVPAQVYRSLCDEADERAWRAGMCIYPKSQRSVLLFQGPFGTVRLEERRGGAK